MVSSLLKGHSIILGFLGAKWPQGLTFDAENKTQILTITQFWKSYHDRNIWTRSKLSKMPQNSFCRDSEEACFRVGTPSNDRRDGATPYLLPQVLRNVMVVDVVTGRRQRRR